MEDLHGQGNIGIELARGNFIALCDADDIWHRDKLRIQSNIAKNTNAKFITCARKIIKDYNDYDVCSVFDRCSYKLINKSDFGIEIQLLRHQC